MSLASSSSSSFLTVKNTATMQSLTIADTLTVLIVAHFHLLTVRELTATGRLQIGDAGTFSAAPDNTLSAVITTNLVLNGATTRVTGALMPLQGRTVAAALPSVTLRFSYGILTNVVNTAFMTIATGNVSPGSSDAQSFALPLVATGTYNFTVGWGDGSLPSVITAYNQPDVVHTYATGGSYVVAITGPLTGWVFNNAGDVLKVTNIASWGDIVLGNAGETGFFYGCSNLTVSQGAGCPLRPGVATSLENCFYGCVSLDANLSSWDTSSVTSMSTMFFNCSVFNNGGAPLTWNTAQVTDMSHMFQGALLFNQTVVFSDTSRVTDMSIMFGSAAVFNNGDGVNPLTFNASNVLSLFAMFDDAQNFNQQLVLVDTSKVTAFNAMFRGAAGFNNGGGVHPFALDMTSATTTAAMLEGASAFNQRVSFSNTGRVELMGSMFRLASVFNNGDAGNTSLAPLVWDTASVTNTSLMFYGCSAFNQALTFSDVSQVTDMGNMLHGCNLFKQDLSAWHIYSTLNLAGFYTGDINFPDSATSQANYDALLNSWAAQDPQAFLTFDMGTSKYSAVGQPGHDYLVTGDGWTINDGGLA